MKTSIEKLPKSRLRLTIELSEDEFAKYRQRAFLRLSAQTEVKGFRPGKAPEDLIKNKIGKDKIFQQALEMCLPETYFSALKKEKITPVADPQVKIKKYEEEKPLVYTAEVDILPEFNLPDYKKVKIKSKKVQVGEKELADSLKNLQKSYAEYKDKKEAAKKGDKIEIDFEGYLKGVKVEQLCSKHHPLVLAEGGFIPGFEEKLIGMKKGETKEFDMEMPQKLRDKFLAGKEVKFKIKMLQVQEVILPKLDDKFAQKIAKGKNLVQLKKELEKSLQKRAELAERRRLETELLNKLADKTEMEIPENLVKNEQFKMLSDLQQDIESKGLPFAKYLESIGKKEEEFLQDLAVQAQKAVKIGLLIGKIKQQEKVKVAVPEIERELEMLKRSGYNIEDEEKARKRIKLTLENQKILAKLVDWATQK